MRRIQAACLLQTMHFLPKDDLEKEQAIKAVDEEVRHYKKNIDASSDKVPDLIQD